MIDHQVSAGGLSKILGHGHISWLLGWLLLYTWSKNLVFVLLLIRRCHLISLFQRNSLTHSLFTLHIPSLLIYFFLLSTSSLLPQFTFVPWVIHASLFFFFVLFCSMIHPFLPDPCVLCEPCISSCLPLSTPPLPCPGPLHPSTSSRSWISLNPIVCVRLSLPLCCSRDAWFLFPSPYLTLFSIPRHLPLSSPFSVTFQFHFLPFAQFLYA